MPYITVGLNADTVIHLEPSPGPVLVPYESEVQFNCTTAQQFIFSKWNFFIGNIANDSYALQVGNVTDGQMILSSDNSTHLQILLDKGINVTSTSDSFSEVVVKASEANLHLLYVECEAVNFSDPAIAVHQGVNVSVYGTFLYYVYNLN